MLTAPSQGLNEVDVAYIRAARGSRIVVSAASTGATHKLTSWRWRIEADGAPVHLSDTYNQVGGDVKDHALLPNQSSGAHPRLFLSAARRPTVAVDMDHEY